MNQKHDLYLCDLFAGGGGFSTGIARACKKLNKTPDLIAVNHWDKAVETHKANHPWARHYCTGLDAVVPTAVSKSPRLQLLSASPECTHHANARGSKPMSDQSRSSAWLILKWLQELYVESVLIENIEEFEDWGPLGANGRPLKSMKGQLFTQFVSSLKALGYNVEWKVKNSANYGAYTARERLFIMARRGANKRIVWPDETHANDADLQIDMFAQKAKWKAAREVIDWSRPSQSIFGRKKPLAPKTIERIMAGARKFWGKHAEPFLVVMRNHMNAQSLNDPIPSLAANGLHMGLCEPFIVTAGGATGQGRQPRDLNEPFPTVLTHDRHALVQPFLMTVNHVDKYASPSRSHDIDAPLPTVTAERRGLGIVEPFFFNMQRAKDPILSVDRPMPTITATSSDYGLCEPFLISYYGTHNVSSVDQPVPTCTSKSRFGLVEVGKGMYLDIHFRMLHWSELAAAMGFPPDYHFAGSGADKVKQIGNAVECTTAEKLALAALAA